MIDVVSGGWDLQEEFDNPKELIQRAHDVIAKNESFVSTYREINMGYPEFITLRLHGVYENGIVYNIFCHADAAAEKYNTITSALLIVRKDGTVKFIIDAIDGRVNGREKGSDSYVRRCNQPIVKEELDALGKRIDRPLFDDKINIFNRHRKEKLRELTLEKVNLLIRSSLLTLEKLLEEKKEQKGKK